MRTIPESPNEAEMTPTPPEDPQVERTCSDDVTIVIPTWNRSEELARCLDRLAHLPHTPPIIVVDNGSEDSTVSVASRQPGVAVIELGRNMGAAGRNFGAAAAHTTYVAFCDDDAGWPTGSLERAVSAMTMMPDVAVLAPAIHVRDSHLDPVCEAMASSPLGVHPVTNWPFVLGFLACAVIVRRKAFLSVGGFAPWLLIGGEESLLAIDLTAAGWQLVYAADIPANHDPSPTRDASAREQLVTRNALLIAWKRRRSMGALRVTAREFSAAARQPRRVLGIARALAAFPSVVEERDRVDQELEASLTLLDRAQARRRKGR